LPDAQQNSIRQLVNQDGHWVVAESGTQDA
jgi:hypothetical protein